MKDSTETSKNFLAEITGTNAKEWARTKKENVDGKPHRSFKHSDGSVAVVAFDGKPLIVELYRAEKLAPKTFDGDVIFMAGDDDEQYEDEFIFFCGKKDGDHLSDRHDPDVGEVIENALKRAGFDSDRIEVEMAEAMHGVGLCGEKRPDIYKKVKKALEEAGATEKLR